MGFVREYEVMNGLEKDVVGGKMYCDEILVLLFTTVND